MLTVDDKMKIEALTKALNRVADALDRITNTGMGGGGVHVWHYGNPIPPEPRYGGQGIG